MMRQLWRKLRGLKDRAWVKLFADEYSICEYFRRQGATIGKQTRILVDSLGNEPFLVSIGDHCTISFDVAFITHDGGTWIFRDKYPMVNKFGAIVIHDNCFIGARAILLPGVEIGPNSVVGAGAIVTRNVPPETVAVGCPAHVVCTVEEYARKCIDQSLPLTPRASLRQRRAELVRYLMPNRVLTEGTKGGSERR